MSKKQKLHGLEDASKTEERTASIKGRAEIDEHEGRKYLRRIKPACPNDESYPIYIDVYCVLKAFNVTCPATQHCIKKLLAAGQRGKGDRIADLKGAMAALNRAIDLAEEDLRTCEDFS